MRSAIHPVRFAVLAAKIWILARGPVRASGCRQTGRQMTSTSATLNANNTGTDAKPAAAVLH